MTMNLYRSTLRSDVEHVKVGLAPSDLFEQPLNYCSFRRSSHDSPADSYGVIVLHLSVQAFSCRGMVMLNASILIIVA